VSVHAPQPRGIVGRQDTRALPPCPQPLVAQAHWLASNMARVRLGTSKLQVVGIVGSPAHAETFMLTNGAVIEVLFYHTPETICRVPAQHASAGVGLMPLVFQDDRLLGYGPHYYRDFVVPMLRQKMKNDVQHNGSKQEDGADDFEARVPMVRTEPLPQLVREPAVVQEHLPTPPVTMRSTPYGGEGRNGYSGGMRTEAYPVGYYESVPTRTWLGRGDPLR